MFDVYFFAWITVYRCDIIQIIGEGLLHTPLHRARHTTRKRKLHAHAKGNGNAYRTLLSESLIIPFGISNNRLGINMAQVN